MEKGEAELLDRGLDGLLLAVEKRIREAAKKADKESDKETKDRARIIDAVSKVKVHEAFAYLEEMEEPFLEDYNMLIGACAEDQRYHKGPISSKPLPCGTSDPLHMQLIGTTRERLGGY